MRGEDALFEAGPRREGGTKALVCIDPAVCPACGADTVPVEWAQQPLLRHGGYGAATVRRVRSCERCPWSLLAETSEERPA